MAASSGGTARIGVDLSARWPVARIDDGREVHRPLGLIAALRSDGAEDLWAAGASARVRTTADLETYFPRYVAAHFVDPLTALVRSATMGPAVREFVRARAVLVRDAASIVEVVGEAHGAHPSVFAAVALDAWAERPMPEIHDASIDYVRAYEEMLSIACDVRGEDLAPIYNLDIAHNDARSRARMLPLHPLWVKACLVEDPRTLNDRLPAVIALSGRGISILRAEGEPSFFHDRASVGPTARAIAVAASAAVLELASVGGPDIHVDLLDTRFAARVLTTVRDTLARDQVRTRVHLCFLASTPRDKIDLFVPIEADVLGTARDRLDWEPSVRIANGARPNFTVASLWSPHFGPTPEASPLRPSAYERWLVANEIEPLGRRAGVARIDPAVGDRCLAYAAYGRPPSSASPWMIGQIDGCSVGVRTERTDGPAARALASEERRDSLIGTVDRSPSHDARTEPTHAPAGGLGAARIAQSDRGQSSARIFTRDDVLGSFARAFGCENADLAEDVALFAGLARDVVGARRIVIKHRLASEMARLVASVPGITTGLDVIADSIERSVLVGDLVERRESERGPYVVELASPTLVRWPGTGGHVMLLGRAEEILGESARTSLRLRGPVRFATLSANELDESRFRGANVLDSIEWAGVPPIEKADDRLRRVEMQAFRGDLSSFSVFEPRSESLVYMRRFRERHLSDVLARDRIALARRAIDYGGAEYRLFRRDGERDLAASIHAQDAVTFAAACAARVGGQRLTARVSGDVLRAHFPPTRWMERMAATGSRAPLDGALVAYRLKTDVIAAMAQGLRDSMFCDVASE